MIFFHIFTSSLISLNMMYDRVCLLSSKVIVFLSYSVWGKALSNRMYHRSSMFLVHELRMAGLLSCALIVVAFNQEHATAVSSIYHWYIQYSSNEVRTHTYCHVPYLFGQWRLSCCLLLQLPRVCRPLLHHSYYTAVNIPRDTPTAHQLTACGRPAVELAVCYCCISFPHAHTGS